MSTIDTARPARLSKAERESRDALWLRQYDEGVTLDAIAKPWDVTRERVRQVVEKNGRHVPKEARKRLRYDARDAERRDRADALLAERPDATRQEVAEHLGCSHADVRRYVPAEVDRHWRETMRAHIDHTVVFTGDAMLESLRQAAREVGEPLTHIRYEAWQREQPEGAHSGQVRIAQHFGKWKAACEAAGVQPGRTLRASYSTAWDDASLRRWVATFLLDADERGTPTSYAAFDAWTRARKDAGAPSAQTVRNRLGRWGVARAEVRAGLADGSVAPA